MAVLIEGMEMPSSCGDCRFCGGIADTDCGPCAWFDVDGKARVAGTRQDCPLVPVQPHGRLVDEENICGKLRPLIENPYCYNRMQIISETLAHCLRIISDAPTSIPASEEG